MSQMFREKYIELVSFFMQVTTIQCTTPHPHLFFHTANNIHFSQGKIVRVPKNTGQKTVIFLLKTKRLTCARENNATIFTRI